MGEMSRMYGMRVCPLCKRHLVESVVCPICSHFWAHGPVVWGRYEKKGYADELSRGGGRIKKPKEQE